MSTDLDKIVSLCKRRGFAFPAADMYGGVTGVYDVGHVGVLLKKNIRAAWLNHIQSVSPDIILFEGSLLGPEAVWRASGHIENFNDPLVDCQQCKHRFRADDVDLQKACPTCGIMKWTPVRQFNMMFKTHVGAVVEQGTDAYLRPETAQSIFSNFKNIYTTNRVKIPFGVAQIGKAFRNEITPKQFLFRMREFEQMELEWFCTQADALAFFEQWRLKRREFYTFLGITQDHIRMRDHAADELSHYSSATSDVEYLFPFGWKEIEGIAYRGNYDLQQHMEHSGKDLSIYDEQTKSSFIPHVVECSVGVDRLFLLLLCDAYTEDVIENEPRIVLKFAPRIAPYLAAIMPLTKKQNERAHAVYTQLAQKYAITYDDSGSIGKRYRRQDEIGTPVCLTFDFETDECVTARNRDTTIQERISIDHIAAYLNKLI